MKKLTLSSSDKMISGVMGGLGFYFDIDPVIFRLLYVLLSFATGIVPGIVIYIIAVIVIPKEIPITPTKPAVEDVFANDAPEI